MTSEYVCTLSPEMLRKAEAELNERPQWRDRDVMALRQMVIDSADLHCPTEYAFLLRFLRVKKFDYDRAFAAIRRYYEVRAKYPQIFGKLLPSSVQSVLDDGVVTVLPASDSKGRRVIWFRPGLWDLDAYPMVDILKAILLVADWIIRDEQVQVNGIVVLEDCTGAGWQHFRQLNKESIQIMALMMQDAFPVRLKATHLINTPLLMKFVLSVLRIFVKQKIRDRIHVHGSNFTDALSEDLGEATVPTEYGGRLLVRPGQWRDEIMSPNVEAYFQCRLSDGYIDAAKKLASKEEASTTLTPPPPPPSSSLP